MDEKILAFEENTLMEGKALTSEEKTLAVVSHLASLVGYFVIIGHIVIPLIILLWKGKESEFTEYHSRESLNFQISMTIYWIITYLLMFVFVGFIIAIPLSVFQLIVMIIAALRAGDGRTYSYPLCIRFIK